MEIKPTTFFAFSNDQDAHLDTLRKEGRGIEDALFPLHKNNFIEFHIKEGADIEDLFQAFNRFNNEIAIFHYGGHANGSQLKMVDASADSRGVAELLGSQKHLKLVFLNGCSTKEHVKLLLEHGVKAIIATSVPIKDQMATEFSIIFYKNLSFHLSIEESFQKASTFVQTKYGHKNNLDIRRSFLAQNMKEDEELPWGLYIKEGHEEILTWSLPKYERIEFPEGFGKYLKPSYSVNEYILSVLEEMIEHNPALSYKTKDQFGNPKDPRELPSVLIEGFPWPVGAQLRILFVNRGTMNQPGFPRLKQLISTYSITSRFILYILLSQLWDEAVIHDQRPEFDIGSFIPDQKGATSDYDSIRQIRKLVELFRSEGIMLFLQELNDLFGELNAESDIVKSYEYLQSVSTSLYSGQEIEGEMNELCNQTEYCLSILLKKVAFLAKYQLVTIKDIAIFSPKRTTPSFAHYLGYLNATDSALLPTGQRKLKKYTNSHSVILVKSGDMQEFLNVSPFLIDKNAFGTEADSPPHIFILAWEEAGTYSYLFVNHNTFESLEKEDDQFSTSNPHHQEMGELIQRQFQMMKEDLHSEPPTAKS